MSTRTIIEVNHDYIHDLLKPDGLKEFMEALRAGFMHRHIEGGDRVAPGIRVLGQRHHSETLKLTVR